MNDAGSVLQSIFSGCEGKVEIRPLPPSPERPARFFDNVVAAEEYAQLLNGKADVYFGAATRARESGTKQDVKEIGAVWADCDTATSVARLPEFPFRPTIEIETSPGRRHVWWLLREPLLVEDGVAVARVEAVLRGIADILGSDSSVAELARIMRVPGTQNLKRGAPCHVLRDDGPRYELDDFINKGITREEKRVPAGSNGHGGADKFWVATAWKGVGEGERHTVCVKLAGYLIRKHPRDIALTMLEGWGGTCTPAYPVEDVRRDFYSIYETVERDESSPAVGDGTFESLRNTVTEFLLLADKHVLDVVGGGLVGNLFRSDPLWVMLVQAPSTAKTEILEGTSGIPAIYPLSDLTACTFLSGTPKKLADNEGTEPSLLPTLDGRILMLKDFGTILSMHRDKRSEILAQLREIYDGHYTKQWGSGKRIEWRGHVGFLGGVTTAIDTHYSALNMLGERFTLYRAEAPNRKEVAKRAIKNVRGTNAKRMRARIAAAFKAWFDGLQVPKLEDVGCDDETQEAIGRLADLTAQVRTGVARDGYSRFILTRPEAEGPGRLARQFYILAAGIAVAHGRTAIGAYELGVIKRVATSTMPAQRTAALAALVARPAGVWTQTRPIAGAMLYPFSTAKEILEDLLALGLVEQDLAPGTEESSDGKKDTRPYEWRIKDTVRGLINECDLGLSGDTNEA